MSDEVEEFIVAEACAEPVDLGAGASVRPADHGVQHLAAIVNERAGFAHRRHADASRRGRAADAFHQRSQDIEDGSLQRVGWVLKPAVIRADGGGQSRRIIEESTVERHGDRLDRGRPDVEPDQAIARGHPTGRSDSCAPPGAGVLVDDVDESGHAGH